MFTMEKELSDHLRTKVLRLSGNWDRDFGLYLEDTIAETVNNHCHHLILDFSPIQSIDRSGLVQLLMWYHRLSIKHIQISIVDPLPTIRDALEEAFSQEMIPIYDSLPEAIERDSALAFH